MMPAQGQNTTWSCLTSVVSALNLIQIPSPLRQACERHKKEVNLMKPVLDLNALIQTLVGRHEESGKFCFVSPVEKFLRQNRVLNDMRRSILVFPTIALSVTKFSTLFSLMNWLFFIPFFDPPRFFPASLASFKASSSIFLVPTFSLLNPHSNLLSRPASVASFASRLSWPSVAPGFPVSSSVLGFGLSWA